MGSCSQCGSSIPSGQSICSMCMGDINHGKDGYYEEWALEQERKSENSEDGLKDRGEGFCPKCGYPLSNWGACSRGDGDIYDEIGCDRCEEVIEERHASYCTCPDCDPYGIKGDFADDDSTDPNDSRNL